MEIVGVRQSFALSGAKYNVHYEKYLREGDSKAFKKKNYKTYYGQDFLESKLECVDVYRNSWVLD